MMRPMSTWPSDDARQAYINDEATEMLLFDLSYEERRRMIASARRREVLDFGCCGVHTSLLEPDVRIRVNDRLAAAAFTVAETRDRIVFPPERTKKWRTSLLAKETTPPNLLCIGADGASTPCDCRFDDSLPPRRFDTLLLVTAQRPGEHDNDASFILGAAGKEAKTTIEAIIDDSQVLVGLPEGTIVYILVDGGGIYKFAPHRGHCDFCGLTLAHINDESETSLKPEVTATTDSFRMLVNIPPTRIVGGLLHGLCTIVLRIRKRGLTDDERANVDRWYEAKTGVTFVRNKNAKKREAEGNPTDGKLEIEALDRLLMPVSASVRAEVADNGAAAAAAGGAGEGAAGRGPGGGRGGGRGDGPGARVRGGRGGRGPGVGGKRTRDGRLAAIKKKDDSFDEALTAWPERWRPALRRIRQLREATVEPEAQRILTSIHDDCIRYAPREGKRIWTLGCHFVAHSIAFAIKFAGADLRVLHEQLVERNNQRFKSKCRHWSGDATRSCAALNAVADQRICPRGEA